MTTRSKWLLAGLGGLAVIGGGVFWFKASRSRVTYETETIGRGTVIQEVAVTGSITPARKIELQPETSGKVAAVKVKEGDEVKAGALLVEIDSRDLLARIASQRAAVDSAKARLAELVAGPTAQELALAEAAVATAQTKLDAAIAAKADAETAVANSQGNYDNVVVKAATQIEAKRAQLVIDMDEASTAAKDAISRITGTIFTTDGQLTFTSSSSAAETDARNTFLDARAALPDIDRAIAAAKAAATVDAALSAEVQVSAGMRTVKANLDADVILLDHASSLDSSTKSSYQSTVNAALTGVNAALQALVTSRANLELQKDLNDADLNGALISLTNAKSSLTSATFAIQSAQRSLEQAEADLTYKRTGNRPEVIASQRAQVAVQQATLDGLYADLAKRRIVAPIDGVITDVAVAKGETVQPGVAAVTMNAKGNFEIVTNISEIDIAKVAVGDPVTVTLDAFPRSETWTGKVGRIDPGEKVVESVIFYETTIVFDNEDPRLRPGMTANLSIETARRENVLRVPLRAVRERGDKAYVDLLVAGKPVEKEISVGIENDVYGEVLGGLSEGDTVIVATKDASGKAVIR